MTLKNVIGILVCVAGIGVALYIGVWWAFIGGFVDVIEAAKTAQVEPVDVITGIAKAVFLVLSGTITGGLICEFGESLLD